MIDAGCAAVAGMARLKGSMRIDCLEAVSTHLSFTYYSAEFTAVVGTPLVGIFRIEKLWFPVRKELPIKRLHFATDAAVKHTPMTQGNALTD